MNTRFKTGRSNLIVAPRLSVVPVARNCSSSLVMQHQRPPTKVTWDPMQIFTRPADHKYAVVILNRPILWKHETVLRIWEEAQVTVTVDGGTDRWLTYWEQRGIDVLSGECKNYIPDLITGDMDSCSPLTIERFKAMGSTVIKTPDQNLTDYTKALLQLGQSEKVRNIRLDGIYVFAETSGRFDHIIGNINTLYKSDAYVGDVPIIQIASNSLTWLLKPGCHTIKIPEILVQKNCWCGLLPFGSSVNSVTTTGLKWNLNNSSMQFGAVVSTSNTYAESSEVTINTDTALIWTMGIEPLNECFYNCKESYNCIKNGL